MAMLNLLCAVLLLLVGFVTSSNGVSYTVGDSSGWTIPSENNLNYDHWASSHTFHVGDSIIFNYAAELHSVLQVTHSSYKQCNITSPFSTSSDGKTVINLSHKGSYYFICGIPGHCQAGQRLQLKVVDASGHVEASRQAAATRNGAAISTPAPAPAPAPGIVAVPPATASAPCFLHSKKVIMSLMIESIAAYVLCPYAFT